MLTDVNIRYKDALHTRVHLSYIILCISTREINNVQSRKQKLANNTDNAFCTILSL